MGHTWRLECAARRYGPGETRRRTRRARERAQRWRIHEWAPAAPRIIATGLALGSGPGLRVDSRRAHGPAQDLHVYPVRVWIQNLAALGRDLRDAACLTVEQARLGRWSVRLIWRRRPPGRTANDALGLKLVQGGAHGALGQVGVATRPLGARERVFPRGAALASPTSTALHAGFRLPSRSRGTGPRLSADEIASTLTGGPLFRAPVCCGVKGIRKPDACRALAQFLSHSPPYGTVRHRSPEHHQAKSRAVTASCGRRSTDLESVLGCWATQEWLPSPIGTVRSWERGGSDDTRVGALRRGDRDRE